jgi:hypothetical protein
MSRTFAIHEYELTHDTDSQEFEQVPKDILLSKEPCRQNSVYRLFGIVQQRYQKPITRSDDLQLLLNHGSLVVIL